MFYFQSFFKFILIIFKVVLKKQLKYIIKNIYF